MPAAGPSLLEDERNATRDSLHERKSIFSASKFRTHVIFLAAAFCLIFMAFSASQNFQTSEDSAGSTALGILYISFTISTLVSSYIVKRVNLRLCFFLSATTYVFFVSVSAFPRRKHWILYSAAVLEGVGAAVLWTAQGTFITYKSIEHEQLLGLRKGTAMGYFSGIFFSIYFANQFLGNLIVALLFQTKFSSQTIFTGAAGLCAFGAILLLFIPGASFAHKTEIAIHSHVDSGYMDLNSLKSRRWILSCYEFICDVKFLLLIPYILLNGLGRGIIFGAFPALISNNSIKFYMMSMFGLVNAISSVISGRVSSFIGGGFVIFIGMIAYLIAFLGFIFKLVDSLSPVWLLAGIAVIFGIADGIIITQLYAILGTVYEKEPESAFSRLKFFQSLSMASSFFYYKYLSIIDQSYLCLSIAIIASICLIIFEKLGIAKEAFRSRREFSQESLMNEVSTSVRTSV